MLGITIIACASWVIGCGNYDHDFPIYLSCNESQLCFIYIVAFSTRSFGADGRSGTDHSVAAHFFGGPRIVNRVGLEKRDGYGRDYHLNNLCCSTRSCFITPSPPPHPPHLFTQVLPTKKEKHFLKQLQLL